MSRLPPLLSVLIATLTLAACNSTGPATTAGPSPSAATGCAGEIGRYQTVLDNDLQTGNVNKSVYDRATADLARASTACSAGRDAEAVRLVAATKSRYGYF
jgi:hypothetical protein